MRKTQQEVYDTLTKYGPLADHALVPIMQHECGSHQSSSGIRSRRAELFDSGDVQEVGAIKMPSGREAVVWGVV